MGTPCERDLLQSAHGSAGVQAISGHRSPVRPSEGAVQPCRVRAGPPRCVLRPPEPPAHHCA
eukprot:8673137-Alexandrium_andersonii.AAC.1